MRHERRMVRNLETEQRKLMAMLCALEFLRTWITSPRVRPALASATLGTALYGAQPHRQRLLDLVWTPGLSKRMRRAPAQVPPTGKRAREFAALVPDGITAARNGLVDKVRLGQKTRILPQWRTRTVIDGSIPPQTRPVARQWKKQQLQVNAKANPHQHCTLIPVLLRYLPVLGRALSTTCGQSRVLVSEAKVTGVRHRTRTAHR